MQRNDILEICCPLCSDTHKYELEIRRSFSMSLNFKNPSEQPSEQYFTRLFTCPTNGKIFQARFTVRDTPNTTIKSVEVKRLVKAEEE
jgi:hypothetical protein